MEPTTLKNISELSAKETINSESNSNKKLTEAVKIENTPFTAIRLDETWFLTMGKYRLTNQLGSLEECKAEAADSSWERIMTIIKIMLIEHDLEKQLEKTISNQENKTIN